MRSDRLLAMLLLLQTHGQMSATRLAETLEVSVRTVYRDMESLSSAGVPVYAERGRAGGIAILPDFRTDLTGLTADEARALFVLVNESAHGELGFGEALKSSLRKLMAALPEAQRTLAERSTERIIIDPSRWGGRGRDIVHLKSVQEAVLTDRQLRIGYEQRDSVELLQLPAVDPHGLVHRGGSWYLVATVNGADRQFRVDRIREAELLDAPTQRPKGYQLAAAWRALNEAWEQDYSSVTVTVRVQRDAVGLFQRVMADELLDPIDRTVDSGEWTEVRVRMRSFGHAQTLLGFGTRIAVTEPVELVEHLAEVAQQLNQQYVARSAATKT